MRGWVGLDSSSLDVTHNARTKSTVEGEGEDERMRGRMKGRMRGRVKGRREEG